MGVDGISMPLVLLTAFLGFMVILISWKEHQRVREYFSWLLLLETSILGVFASLDLVLFFRLGFGKERILGHQVRAVHAFRQRLHAGRYPQPVLRHRQPGHG